MCITFNLQTLSGAYKETNIFHKEGESYNYHQSMRCGYCDQCRHSRAVDWGIRNHYEQVVSKYSYFILLTYNDKHLPKGGYLNYPDTQYFQKRMRKKGYDYRYYLVGEYGDVTHRPHYHIIMYTNTPLSINAVNTLGLTNSDIQVAWKNGNTTVQQMDESLKTMFYVSLYMAKSRDLYKKIFAKYCKENNIDLRPDSVCNAPNAKDILENAKKEIKKIYNRVKSKALFSLAVGYDGFIQTDYKNWLKTNTVYVDGRAYQIPYPWLLKLADKDGCMVAKNYVDYVKSLCEPITDETTMKLKKQAYRIKMQKLPTDKPRGVL